MGSSITDQANPALRLKMSSGLTTALYDTLAIAAASLAKSSWEREFCAWLTWSDHSMFGDNCRGFDLSEIFWNEAEFRSQKTFICQVIDRSRIELGRGLLPYEPRRDWLVGALSQFKDLIENYRPNFSTLQPPRSWPKPEDCRFGLCPQHQVFLHAQGCLICNNAPLETSSD